MPEPVASQETSITPSPLSSPTRGEETRAAGPVAPRATVALGKPEGVNAPSEAKNTLPLEGGGQGGGEQARIAALENRLNASVGDFAAFKVTADKLLESARTEMVAAVKRVAEAVRSANPDIPPELITGATLGEVDGSLSAARALVEKVKAQLKAANTLSLDGRGKGEGVSTAAPSVPAGAPGRMVDYGDLSPLDKIKAGIKRAATRAS
jgi:hypothetical protein